MQISKDGHATRGFYSSGWCSHGSQQNRGPVHDPYWLCLPEFKEERIWINAKGNCG